jgi:hypothetical protein
MNCLFVFILLLAMWTGASVGVYVERIISAWGLLGGIAALVVFFSLLVATVTAYLNVSTRDPGYITADLEKAMLASGGDAKSRCNKCMLLKPARAHHCSICKRCVLKMDHHCPWVDNCVGFKNYKFFLLFLIYGTLTVPFAVTLLIVGIRSREGSMSALVTVTTPFFRIIRTCFCPLLSSRTISPFLLMFISNNVAYNDRTSPWWETSCCSASCFCLFRACAVTTFACAQTTKRHSR